MYTLTPLSFMVSELQVTEVKSVESVKCVTNKDSPSDSR